MSDPESDAAAASPDARGAHVAHDAREIVVARDSPMTPDVAALLTEHLTEMREGSPPESVHALDQAALAAPDIEFVSVRTASGELLACGALTALNDEEGELKSMRTTVSARGRGIGARLLDHLIAVARHREYAALYLETGSQESFAPARRLYARAGFRETEPFGDYRPDPLSTFMVLTLSRDEPVTAS